jgi:hypothetical protein
MILGLSLDNRDYFNFATSGAGTSYLSGAPEFTLGFN